MNADTAMTVCQHRLPVGFLLLLCFTVAWGCTPRVIVHSNPGRETNGIRYYRPKPYLKIEPAEVAVDKTTTKFVPGMLRITLEYLPDFSEEYAIDVRSGLGVANVGIKLQDGWNLTEISQDLDSQTDENVKAVGSLISSIGDVMPSASIKSADPSSSFIVQGHNVPVGYYESVIGRDAQGCKRLYGFRYLGFIPFASCPIEMSGHDHACCGDPMQSMYGLTYRDGQMVFESLSSMAVTPATASDISMAQNVESAAASFERERSQSLSPTDLSRLPFEMRGHLDRLGYPESEVTILFNSVSDPVVRVLVPQEIQVTALREELERWLRETYAGVAAMSLELDNFAVGNDNGVME